MLCIMSISAVGACVRDGPAGAAPPSACNAMTKAAVKIAIHLNIHGIRRDYSFQVIDLVRKPELHSSATL
jgi:hypothetical protein